LKAKSRRPASRACRRRRCDAARCARARQRASDDGALVQRRSASGASARLPAQALGFRRKRSAAELQRVWPTGGAGAGAGGAHAERAEVAGNDRQKVVAGERVDPNLPPNRISQQWATRSRHRVGMTRPGHEAFRSRSCLVTTR